MTEGSGRVPGEVPGEVPEEVPGERLGKGSEAALEAGAGEGDEIEVEVAYARPDRQRIVRLTVPRGTTLMEAVQRSGITELFPEIDLGAAEVGIFGKVEKHRDRVLRALDRVEIYRPLLIDPKVKRAERAAAQRARASGGRSGRRR